MDLKRRPGGRLFGVFVLVGGWFFDLNLRLILGVSFSLD